MFGNVRSSYARASRSPGPGFVERGGGEQRADQRAERVALVFADGAAQIAQESGRCNAARHAEHLRQRGLQPGCASEIASWTPTRPRATSERTNSRQNA